ncbi:glutamine dumper 2-like protein [Tanacetum coccineum]
MCVMALPSPPTFWRLDYGNAYVFGVMLLVILMLIIILSIAVCIELRRQSRTSGGGRRVEIGVYSTKTARALHNGDDETDVSPKTVVIMAGDELPTYLATPADTIDTSHECK